MMTIAEIMTANPLSITRTTTLAQARDLMVEKHIRHLPVIDNDQLVGLVSQRDILAAENSSLLVMEQNSRESYEKTIHVEEFMKTKVVSIDQKVSMLEAALYLQKHKIGCLPVIEQDKLIGIVTDSDFINVAINLLELSSMQDAEPAGW